MATVERISDALIATSGGEPLAVVVEWGLGDTPFARSERARLVIKRLTAPATYQTVAYALSGVPGQVADDGGTTRPFLLPFPTDDAGNPLYQRIVRGYAPMLAPGVYYVALERYTGGAWAAVGDPVAFRVLTRLRHQQTYDLRRNFPDPAYLPGPRSLEEDRRA